MKHHLDKHAIKDFKEYPTSIESKLQASKMWASIEIPFMMHRMYQVHNTNSKKSLRRAASMPVCSVAAHAFHSKKRTRRREVASVALRAPFVPRLIHRPPSQRISSCVYPRLTSIANSRSGAAYTPDCASRYRRKAWNVFPLLVGPGRRQTNNSRSIKVVTQDICNSPLIRKSCASITADAGPS